MLADRARASVCVLGGGGRDTMHVRIDNTWALHCDIQNKIMHLKKHALNKVAACLA